MSIETIHGKGFPVINLIRFIRVIRVPLYSFLFIDPGDPPGQDDSTDAQIKVKIEQSPYDSHGRCKAGGQVVAVQRHE